jgi:hypothetical protein
MLPAIAEWLASIGIRTCIASFDAVPDHLGVIRGLKEGLRRSYYGYMNGLTEEQLLRCFEMSGMRRAEKRVWTTQGIYRFERGV